MKTLKIFCKPQRWCNRPCVYIREAHVDKTSTTEIVLGDRLLAPLFKTSFGFTLDYSVIVCFTNSYWFFNDHQSVNEWKPYKDGIVVDKAIERRKKTWFKL